MRKTIDFKLNPNTARPRLIDSNSTSSPAFNRRSAQLPWTILCLILGYLMPLVSTADDETAAINILVLGDSISAAYGLRESEGWVALMEEHFDETSTPVNVVNASISGDTSSGGVARLPRALEQFKPHIVIIELGGNDGLRGQSLKLMAANLEEMVNLSLAFGAEPLILGMQIPSNYGPAYTKQFAGTFSKVAELADVALVPFMLEPIATDRSYFQPDGVHPTTEAQPLLFEHLKPELERLLNQITQK